MGGEGYRDILLKNFIKSSFSKSNYLKNITMNMLDKVFNKFKFLNFEKHKTVIPKGFQINSKLIIIIEGSIIDVLVKYKKRL